MIKEMFLKFLFNSGKYPFVEIPDKATAFIPENFDSVLLISADFELAWAWCYDKRHPDPYQLALEKARLERNNVPGIINLCEEYNIPITWLTVGHLFLESCVRDNNHVHAHIPRLSHFENSRWRFDHGDWFQFDPCSTYLDAPEWYCPDLIRMITNARVKHEIGCHTFSHIDCSDKICPPDLLRAELKECKKLAQEWGIDLKSFVPPAHTIGNHDLLVSEGFTSFRNKYRNVLGYPLRHKSGLWEFKQTASFFYRKEWSVDYHIHMYNTILKRAILSNTLCVFTFHPSFDPILVKTILPEVFRFANENRDKIWIATHTEYVNWLESNMKQ